MSRLKFFIICTAFLLLSISCVMADRYTYQDVYGVPRKEIDSWIKSSIAKSGADPMKGRYHFVVAFSTGHYGSNPIHAIAMRRVAFQLLNNTLVPGDLVTAAAWEMNVWKIGRTIKLNNNPGSRGIFVDDVPMTPNSNSRGGHDIERSAVTLIRRLTANIDLTSTVLILITNGASQLPRNLYRNDTLLGENSHLLRNTLANAGYSRPARKDFIVNTKRGKQTISIVTVIPSKLRSLSNMENRYPSFAKNTWQPKADMPGKNEKLPNPVDKQNLMPQGVFPYQIIAIVILLILLIFLVIYYWNDIRDFIKPPFGKKPDGEPKPPIPLLKPIPCKVSLKLNGKETHFEDLQEDSIIEIYHDCNAVKFGMMAKDQSEKKTEQSATDTEHVILWELKFERNKKDYDLVLQKNKDVNFKFERFKYVKPKELDINSYLFKYDDRDILSFDYNNDNIKITIYYTKK